MITEPQAELIDVPAGYFPPAVDYDSRRFWQAAADHRFLLQQCTPCGTFRWPPRTICWKCGSRQYTETDASGRGNVYSWTVIHQATLSTPREKLPYTVVMVALTEDSRILVPGQLADDRSKLAPGAAVECVYTWASADVTVVQWRFSGGSSPAPGSTGA